MRSTARFACTLLAMATMAPAALVAQADNPLPDGWEARLDRANSAISDVRFAPTDEGVHITLGPSGIFYRPGDEVTGAYTATATFTQTRAPQHPEAYGLIIGGQNLKEPNQNYLYFIIRGNGQYMVRHRAGDEVHTIADWTEHPAIVRQDESGRQTNTLTVESTADALRLLVNDQEIANYSRADVPYLNTDGIVGLRVNHNLDLVVTGFEVE